MKKKLKAKKPRGAKPMAKSVYKKGGQTKGVKAPPGFHWMKDGSGFKLMKHSGKFVKHPGASLTAKFKIQKRHSKG